MLESPIIWAKFSTSTLASNIQFTRRSLTTRSWLPSCYNGGTRMHDVIPLVVLPPQPTMLRPLSEQTFPL